MTYKKCRSHYQENPTLCNRGTHFLDQERVFVGENDRKVAET